MHFYTLFAIFCAIVVSNKVLAIEDTCINTLQDRTRLTVTSKTEIDKIELKPSSSDYIKAVEIEEGNLIESFRLVNTLCCKKVGQEKSPVDYLKKLDEFLNSYNDFLLNLKTKKPLLDKDDLIRESIEDLIKNVSAKFKELLDCAEINSDEQHKPALTGMYLKGFDVYLEVIDSYDLIMTVP